MNKETGGVVLAFAGFVFLIGAFKGTWQNTIRALLGQPTSSGTNGTGAGSRGVALSGSNFPGTSIIPGANGNPLASAGR